MTPSSGRRPVNKAGSSSGKPAGSTSGKQGGAPKPASPSGRRPAPSATSGRPPAGARTARPRANDDDEPEEPSSAKKAMFFGTIALVFIVLILFVAKWDDLTAAPVKQPEKKVLKDEDILVDVKAIKAKANDQYKAAIKITDQEARNKGIRAALDTLSVAQEKLQALSELDRYKGKEEFDSVFEDIQSKISLDMKVFRESIRMGH